MTIYQDKVAIKFNSPHTIYSMKTKKMESLSVKLLDFHFIFFCDIDNRINIKLYSIFKMSHA
jgi:hypothetical protein